MKSRILKQEYFIDDRLAACGPLAHILYLGLLGLADRDGRLEDRPFPIKVQTLPYYECDVDTLLNQLFSARLINRYEIENKRYIEIIDFSKHQKIHPKEAWFNIPAPKDIAIPCNYIKDSTPSGNFIDTIGKGKGIGISKGNIQLPDTTPEVINSPKEVKKEKTELEKLGSHFRATREQIEKLILEDGEAVFKTRVQTINDYCAANGKSYKDYPAAYRNFRKGDEQRKANKIPLNESRYERSQRNARELHEKLQRGEPLKQTNIFLMKE